MLMMRPAVSVLATIALCFTLPALADAKLDGFARDVDRAESVRAVKTLQVTDAQ